MMQKESFWTVVKEVNAYAEFQKEKKVKFFFFLSWPFLFLSEALSSSRKIPPLRKMYGNQKEIFVMHYAK